MLSRSVKAGILAFGKLTASLSGLLCFAILSRVLDEADYGTYRQAFLVYMASAPILVMGLSQALYYFLPHDPEHERAVVMENLVPLLVTGLLFLLFLVAGGNRLLADAFNNEQLAVVLLVFAPYAICLLPLSSFESALVIKNQVAEVSIFTVVSRLLFLVMVVGAALIWKGAVAPVAGAVLATAIVLPPGLWLMFRAVPKGSAKPRPGAIKRQLTYALPLGIAGMVAGFAQQVDKGVVSAMTDPTTFAWFANGATELFFIGILTGSVTAVLLPDATRSLKDGNTGEALRLWKSAASKTALVVIPIFVALFIFAEAFVAVAFGAKYPESVFPFRIYLFILPLRIVVFSALLMAAGRTRWILYGAIGSLAANLLLSIPFVKAFGPNGAAFASLITLYLWLAPFYLFGVRDIVDRPWSELLPWTQFVKITAVCLVPALLCWSLRDWLPANAFLALPIGLAVYGGLMVLLYWNTGLVHPRDILAHLKQLKGRAT